jgi:N-formylglutamate amidohydrolase
VISQACRIAEQAGFPAAANDPFAGGHVVERHGAPELGIHALQIEIDRRCYLTPTGEPNEGFDEVAQLIETVALQLGRALLDRQLPQAAE